MGIMSPVGSGRASCDFLGALAVILLRLLSNSVSLVACLRSASVELPCGRSYFWLARAYIGPVAH